MGPLQFSHVARELAAVRSTISILCPTFLSTASSRTCSRWTPASSGSPICYPLGKSIAKRYFFSYPRRPAMSKEPQATREVRKYLQQSHERIFENNKKWADEMRKRNPEFFKSLDAGQSPEYLWIGKLCILAFRCIRIIYRIEEDMLLFCLSSSILAKSI